MSKIILNDYNISEYVKEEHQEQYNAELDKAMLKLSEGIERSAEKYKMDEYFEKLNEELDKCQY